MSPGTFSNLLNVSFFQIAQKCNRNPLQKKGTPLSPGTFSLAASPLTQTPKPAKKQRKKRKRKSKKHRHGQKAKRLGQFDYKKFPKNPKPLPEEEEYQAPDLFGMDPIEDEPPNEDSDEEEAPILPENGKR